MKASAAAVSLLYPGVEFVMGERESDSNRFRAFFILEQDQAIRIMSEGRSMPGS